MRRSATRLRRSCRGGLLRIPTSLGVNPSLTISAVCERAAASLIARGPDFGLPQAPSGFSHRRPQEIVGDRVRP